MSQASRLNKLCSVIGLMTVFRLKVADFFWRNEQETKPFSFCLLFSSCWHKWPFFEEDHSGTGEHWKRTNKRGMLPSCLHNHSFWNVFHPPALFVHLWDNRRLSPYLWSIHCKYFLISLYDKCWFHCRFFYRRGFALLSVIFKGVVEMFWIGPAWGT